MKANGHLKTRVAALLIASIGGLVRPTWACDCSSNAGTAQAFPPLLSPDERPFFSPLNAHLFIIGEGVTFQGVALTDPDGEAVPLEIGAQFEAYESQGQPHVAVIEYIPPILRPNTRYAIWLGRATEPLGAIVTGTTVDREAPLPPQSIELGLVRGSFDTSCDYGQPRAQLVLNGALDRDTPSNLLLFRVKAEALMPSEYKSFESLFPSFPSRTQRASQWVALAAGRDNCHMRNFIFPPPLMPAKLTVTAVDMAGNESAPFQQEFLGPHTAESHELTERLSHQSPVDRLLLRAASAKPPAPQSAPAAPKSSGVGVLGTVLGFAVGLALGLVVMARARKRAAA